MISKGFFTGRAIVFSIVIIGGLGIYAYRTYVDHARDTKAPPVTTQEDDISAVSPVFTWKYEPDDSLNLDGLPQTNVYLEASYSGDVVSKLIATVPGGCKDLPEKEDDSVADSTVAQCYAAGYGDRFKVTKGEKSYLVMHQVFEEASPDYIPPQSDYVVVVEFPLTH